MPVPCCSYYWDPDFNSFGNWIDRSYGRTFLNILRNLFSLAATPFCILINSRHVFYNFRLKSDVLYRTVDTEVYIFYAWKWAFFSFYWVFSMVCYVSLLRNWARFIVCCCCGYHQCTIATSNFSSNYVSLISFGSFLYASLQMHLSLTDVSNVLTDDFSSTTC